MKNQINLWRIFSVRIYQKRIIRTYYFFLIKCIWTYIFVFIAGLKNWFGWSLLNLTKKFASCTLHHAHHVFCNQCDKINIFWEIYTCKNYLSWSKKLFSHSNEGIFYMEKFFKHADFIRYSKIVQYLCFVRIMHKRDFEWLFLPEKIVFFSWISVILKQGTMNYVYIPQFYFKVK